MYASCGIIDYTFVKWFTFDVYIDEVIANMRSLDFSHMGESPDSTIKLLSFAE